MWRSTKYDVYSQQADSPNTTTFSSSGFHHNLPEDSRIQFANTLWAYLILEGEQQKRHHELKKIKRICPVI